MHSKVYTDTPATRSPVLTVILAIVILAILTAGALAALAWFQKRAQNRPLNGEPAYALNQTHRPMYNDLTSTTTDLGAHDHIRYF
jgi:flagellar basal body-associated protein FliL